MRVPRATSWADLTIRRSLAWGALARFWVLDTRQYRDDQACGDGADQWPQFARARSENPHVTWRNARRGYVRCEVTAREWRAEYRTVPYVSRPGAPVETPTRWRLAHGRAGAEPA